MISDLDTVIYNIRNGIPILLVDDETRENEVDIVLAAEFATVKNIVFCMNNAKGLMCIPAEKTLMEKLDLPPMVVDSTDKNQTPFTVSVDAAVGTTTGMSVYDRLKTIGVFIDKDAKPSDLNRPGHLFPLRANENLLLGRRGHTEGSVELVKMAGCKPVSIIVEVINDDGTMTKGDKIVEFSKKFNIPIASIEQIYEKNYKSSV